MASVRAGNIDEVLKGAMSLRSFVEVLWFSGLTKNIEVFNLATKAIKFLDNDDPRLEESAEKELDIDNNKEYIINYLTENHVKINGVVEKDDIEITEIDLYPLFNSYNTRPNNVPDEPWPCLSHIYNPDVPDVEVRLLYKKSVPKTKDIKQFVKERQIKINKINRAFELAKNDDREDDISLYWKKYNYNTSGYRGEFKVLNKLRKMGYDIVETRGASRKLGTGIISGRPDGLIENSPKYGKCILEIKSTSKKSMRESSYLQIYSYYYIFQQPVLLVNYHKGNMTFTFYSMKTLAKMWDKIETDLSNSLQSIYNYINVTSFERYNILKEKLAKGKLYF